MAKKLPLASWLAQRVAVLLELETEAALLPVKVKMEEAEVVKEELLLRHSSELAAPVRQWMMW